jgi:hypothetical protein
MAIKLSDKGTGRVVEVEMIGKLTHGDYLEFMPELDRLVQKCGKLRVLFEMIDFHGWDTAAAWDEIKLDIKHFNHLERMAMVGDKKWEKGLTFFARPFTTAEVRYFDRADIAAARTWLEGE